MHHFHFTSVANFEATHHMLIFNLCYFCAFDVISVSGLASERNSFYLMIYRIL